jgi:hypothetical protein
LFSGEIVFINKRSIEVERRRPQGHLWCAVCVVLDRYEQWGTEDGAETIVVVCGIM